MADSYSYNGPDGAGRYHIREVGNGDCIAHTDHEPHAQLVTSALTNYDSETCSKVQDDTSIPKALTEMRAVIPHAKLIIVTRLDNNASFKSDGPGGETRETVTRYTVLVETEELWNTPNLISLRECVEAVRKQFGGR